MSSRIPATRRSTFARYGWRWPLGLSTPPQSPRGGGVPRSVDPWIENRFISHFESLYDKGDNCLSDHFGPFVPLFLPWVDLWVNNNPSRSRYPDGFVKSLRGVLRPDVPYLAVSQNDQGLTGNDEIAMAEIPNVMVLSAGGYGHVPIPLFKQEEARNNRKPVADRRFDASYVGTLGHAPDRSAPRAHARASGQRQHRRPPVHVLQGDNWRRVMADSRLSLCPRGYGRTSYHLAETLQMGLVPVHVYSDAPWVPYGDLFSAVGIVARVSGGRDAVDDNLAGKLSTVTAEEVAARERRIVELRESHFSVDGVLNQIQRFLLNEDNDLRCQKLPGTVQG